MSRPRASTSSRSIGAGRRAERGFLGCARLPAEKGHTSFPFDRGRRRRTAGHLLIENELDRLARAATLRGALVRAEAVAAEISPCLAAKALRFGEEQALAVLDRGDAGGFQMQPILAVPRALVGDTRRRGGRSSLRQSEQDGEGGDFHLPFLSELRGRDKRRAGTCGNPQDRLKPADTIFGDKRRNVNPYSPDRTVARRVDREPYP